MPPHTYQGQDLTGNELLKDFQQLDLKWGYHQTELEPESCGITMLPHMGVSFFTRDINSATEQYQHEIQEIFAGLTGASNTSDDIIIDGSR